MTQNLALADLLFPKTNLTAQDIAEKYPPRQLPEGAAVTRLAPSPTGFIHMGNLVPALTSKRLAQQSNGVFYLRIEDTDQKREVEGGVEAIIDGLEGFGISFDEGDFGDSEIGAYAPYRQRRRADIYAVFARQLVEQGLAYPCFCSEQELEDMRTKQQEQKENFGYFGQWAACRNLTFEQIKQKIDAGQSYVLRFRAPEDATVRVKFTDLVKGDLEFPQNNMDLVLLKSDGIPTYHFAHAVDDHFMGTTHVVRGDEWLATLPMHLQLFDALGFKRPKYLHISPLMKMDGESKRKLSKRKDPELALEFYHQEGFYPPAVIEYLLTLLNSNFEEWRIKNPETDNGEFKFSAKKMSNSGALFDLDKLNDISKNILCKLTAQQILDNLLIWSAKYDPEFFALLDKNNDYARDILQIGRGVAKPRKDIATWSGAKEYMSFFYDEYFSPDYAFPENLAKEDISAILQGYQQFYTQAADQQDWFAKLKEFAAGLGFSPDTKEYKLDPDSYKGHVGDVSMVLRIAITGRAQSPDLYEVMNILGTQKTIERLQRAEKCCCK